MTLAGFTYAAICFALFGLITSLRQTGKLAGLGPEALQTYFKIQTALVAALAAGVLESILAMVYLLTGWEAVGVLAVVVFGGMAVGLVPLGLFILLRLR